MCLERTDEGIGSSLTQVTGACVPPNIGARTPVFCKIISPLKFEPSLKTSVFYALYPC